MAVISADLIERLKRAEAAALEETGHALLPFVQAALLSVDFAIAEPGAVLQAFREEVARAAASVSPAGFAAAVVDAMRARALPKVPADGAQGEALQRLRVLAPLAVGQREVAIARFVERLPADQIGAHLSLDATATAAVLARAATLLAGPCPTGDWTAEASLLDPNAAPTPAFLALENVLSALAIDVTALEAEPLKPAGAPSIPVPVLKPGYEAHAPVEHYPSKVKTQAASDLPAEVSDFVPPAAPRASVPSVPSVVVALEHTPPMLVPPLQRDEQTEPQARALPPPESTDETRNILPKVVTPDDEATNVKGKALAAPEQTEPRARSLPAPVEETAVGRALGALPPDDVPLHRRVPPGWYWGTAALCAVLGVTLYFGLVRYLEVKIRRPWTLVPVLVVTRDFEEGTVLQADMLAIRAIPEQNATQSVVKPEHMAEAMGKRLEFPMQAGDPLLWAQFDPSVKNKRFEVIKRGRAYSVPVTEVKSVGGQLDPLDEIDVVMTFTALPGQPKAGNATHERALTLLQKVRVLSVGKVTTLNVGRVQKRYTDLTLMLVPEEVEVLSLAMRTGELTASMRNADDTDTIERGETNLQTLLSGERQRRLQSKRSQVIDVVRGQK